MNFNHGTDHREDNQKSARYNEIWCDDYQNRGEKKNRTKLVLNYPNQTLAIAERLRTDNVQLTVQSRNNDEYNTCDEEQNTVSVLSQFVDFLFVTDVSFNYR